jgi:hypothetical protein
MENLLPLAVDWASEQEARILRDGVPLSAQQIADAKEAGVAQPESVRLLQVDAIPAPAHPILKAACNAINFLTSAPRGLTLNYGIFVRRDSAQDRHLLLHELAHISQYERLGGMVPFLRKYIFECFTLGYQRAPLELEANEVARRVAEAPGSSWEIRNPNAEIPNKFEAANVPS